MPAAISTESAPHEVVHATLARLHGLLGHVPTPQRRLGKFIFAAALAHIAAFFFILIDNPHSEMRHEMHTDVTLSGALPGAAESPDDAFWDKLTDPRLYVLPQPSPPGTFAVPLGATVTTPVALPAPAEIGSFPFLNQPLPTLDERVNDALQPAREPFAYQENPPPMDKTTTWQWGGGLAGRGPVGAPALPSPVSDTEISPTRLRVAVTPDGTVSDVLLDQSSQKPELDRQAILAVQKVRFQPVNQPGIAWGLVTIAWYYTPKPQEVAPPSAPLAP
jgi:TonB family protein